MKVIDLLNKIANGEEVPRKFKYENKTYIYDDDLREHFDDREFYCFNYTFDLTDYEVLNDEIELIEDAPKEDKKIEKLDLSDWWEITSKEDCKPEGLERIFNKNAVSFSSKINEIIDRLNGE